MSTTKQETSPSSMRPVNNKQQKTQGTQSLPEMSSINSPQGGLFLRTSPSKLQKLFETRGFQIEADNEIGDQLAINAIHLRRHRGLSQAEVAKAMGTSQSAVARIESGDVNVQMSTVKRLVAALHGRIRFAIEPEELDRPHPANWWTVVTNTAATIPTWGLTWVGYKRDATGHHIGLQFTQPSLVISTSGTSRHPK